MSIQTDIASALTNFGLDETDAMLYANLLRMGSITVGTLSSKLNIDRGKAYRSLNKLRNLGMITTTFSNPTTCMAIKPSEALITLLQKKEDEVVIMQKIVKQIISVQDELIHKETVSDISSFSIIQGRANIYTKIGKMIQETAGTICIVTTLEDIMLMYHTSIPEKIKTCIKNGGQVQLLTQVDSEESLPLITRLGANESRIGKLPSKGRMIVEKDKQIIMSGAMRESKDLNDDTDSILHTNSPDMVNNIHSLCTHLWKSSKPLEILSKH